MALPYRSAVVERMLEQKMGLIAHDEATMLAMGKKWLAMENTLEGSIQALAMEMAEVVERGDAITGTMLFRQKRYQSLLAQMRIEIGEYIEWADGLVADNQLVLGKLGAANAAEAVQMTLIEGGEGMGAFFDRLPVSAVENMVGIAGNGGTVNALLQQAYPMAVDQMTDALIRNTLLGINPRQTAREMIDGTAEGLTHSLTVARTEQLRVYREAARQQYASSGLVEGYRRLCAKNPSTCAVCLGLDGEVYPTDELMHVHPNDRCTMVPIVKGMPPVEWESGEEWLRKQPEDVQENIIGKGAKELWDNGEIELSDLARKVEHPEWGPSLQRTSLKDLQPDEMFRELNVDFSEIKSPMRFNPDIESGQADMMDWAGGNLPDMDAIKDKDTYRAVLSYQSENSDIVNQHLRSGLEFAGDDPDLMMQIDLMDSALAPLDHEISLYRGATSIPSSMVEVGTEFIDDGFLSTSMDKYVGFGFADKPDIEEGVRALFQIDVPPEVRGLFLGYSQHDYAGEEIEVLLERGLKFRVAETLDSLPAGDGGFIKHVRLEVIGRG